MEPFLGEIRLIGFSFPSNGWANCNGQLLSISQNTALFSILGTTYGDGIATFALPNLQGAVSISSSATIPLGPTTGEPAHTLA